MHRSEACRQPQSDNAANKGRTRWQTVVFSGLGALYQFAHESPSGQG